MGLPAIESSSRSQDTEALYREHGAAVARFCRSLLRDHAEAEDATQQVFLSAHRALLNGSTPREPLAWLLAVARHECYARFRQRQVSPAPERDAPEGTTPDASVQVLRAGELASVWDEVAQMPSAQRDAFLLREIRGLSYSQLAAELSLSAPSVRSLLVRARTRLRHRLRDVSAGLGGAPWIQALVRTLAGGDGASQVPAATKAAAVGLGALVGGGDVAQAPHHASTPRGPAAARHQAHARVRRAATTAAAAAAPSEDRSGRDVRRSGLERSRDRRDGSRESSSGRQRSREGSGDLGTSTGGDSSVGGHDGSDDTTAVAQPTTQPTKDGSGAGVSTSTSSGSGSTTTASGSGVSGSSGSDGGSGGDSGSGRDGGSGSDAPNG